MKKKIQMLFLFLRGETSALSDPDCAGPPCSQQGEESGGREAPLEKKIIIICMAANLIF